MFLHYQGKVHFKPPKNNHLCLYIAQKNTQIVTFTPFFHVTINRKKKRAYLFAEIRSTIKCSKLTSSPTEKTKWPTVMSLVMSSCSFALMCQLHN